MLHLSEMKIHLNDFSEAVKELRKAKRNLIYSKRTFGGGSLSSPSKASNLPKALAEKVELAMDNLKANIYCLLGVAVFRVMPTTPEVTF